MLMSSIVISWLLSNVLHSAVIIIIIVILLLVLMLAVLVVLRAHLLRRACTRSVHGIQLLVLVLHHVCRLAVLVIAMLNMAVWLFLLLLRSVLVADQLGRQHGHLTLTTGTLHNGHHFLFFQPLLLILVIINL